MNSIATPASAVMYSRSKSLVTPQKASPARPGIVAWLRKERQWPRTRRAWNRFKRVFTTHPAETSESYLQHLWFTIKTSLRMVVMGLLLFIHGVFPFLFTRTVSKNIEKLYLTMRSRIPKTRRDTIDTGYDI